MKTRPKRSARLATRKTIAKAHPKLRALLKAVDYSYEKAADYSGLSYAYVSKLARGESNYPIGEKAIEAVTAGLSRIKSGAHPIGASKRAPRNGPDTGELGLAIVIAETKLLETIYDAGEQLGGKWVYRRKLGDRWLLILQHSDKAQLAVFRAIGRLAYDVVTP